MVKVINVILIVIKIIPAFVFRNIGGELRMIDVRRFLDSVHEWKPQITQETSPEPPSACASGAETHGVCAPPAGPNLPGGPETLAALTPRRP